MSDRDARDPLDDAYLEAERLLESGGEARAARRARVLAEVAASAGTGAGSGAGTGPASLAPPPRRAQRWRSGWAAAAAVAGFGVLVVTFMSRSIPSELPSAIVTAAAPAGDTASPADRAATAASSPRPAGPPSIVAAPPMPSPAAARATPAPVLGAAPQPARVAPPPPAEAYPPPPLPLPPTAPVRRNEALPAGALSQDKAASAPALAQRSAERPAALRTDADAAAALRTAAAAGRTGEVEAALSRGVPVDAPDANGDTALMLSVRRGHVATTALLRRRGADPERLNVAGDSAAALATVSGDSRLEDAVRAPHQ